MKDRETSRYSALLKSVVTSRSSLAFSLNELQKQGLIQRRILETKPIQTEYSLSKKGERIASLLSEMEELLSS
ncbi:MAG: winged helix-turn-helix transcriptional regulator [Nitrososphaerota archaeon]|nr:winged helix-turn-helix transcriptional regulator [Nitrososphaerota archaeon]